VAVRGILAWPNERFVSKRNKSSRVSRTGQVLSRAPYITFKRWSPNTFICFLLEFIIMYESSELTRILAFRSNVTLAEQILMMLFAASSNEGTVEVAWHQGQARSTSFLEKTDHLSITQPYARETVLVIYHPACLEALLTLLIPIDLTPIDTWQLRIRSGGTWGLCFLSYGKRVNSSSKSCHDI